MRKKLFVFIAFVAFSALLFIACNTDEQDGISVGYASENTSTGGNPDNTTAATSGGATTSTSLGSTSTTGSSTTSGTTSGSTTVGSTTSTTSGSTTSTTTPPATNSWFKMNGVTYNCSVTNPSGSGSWIAFGLSGVGDTCLVSFNALPVAGNYAVTPGIPNASSCVVGTINASGLKIYGMSGTVAVSVVSATRRRVTFNLTDCVDGTFSPATMSGDLTTP